MAEPVTTETTEAAPASTSTATGGAPATATETKTTPSFTYQEDRSAWVEPTKFRAAESATNRAMQEATRYRTALETEQRRVAALSGTVTKTPEAEEAERVARAFYALPQFAHLQKLTPEAIERLTAIMESQADLEEVKNYTYRSLASDTVRDVVDKVVEAAGYDMDAEAKNAVADLFRAYMGRLEQADREGTKARYESRDPSLRTEFVKWYGDKFIEPVKRRGYVATAQQHGVRVPRSAPGQPVTTQATKIDFSKFKTVEEMGAAAEEEAVARMKAAGHIQNS